MKKHLDSICRRAACVAARICAVALTADAFGALSPQNYIQDGLIAQWDGIDNAGTGTHDGSATTWKDLTGNQKSWTLVSGSAWFSSAALEIQGSSNHSAYLPGTLPSYKTLEISLRWDSGQQVLSNTDYKRIFILNWGDCTICCHRNASGSATYPVDARVVKGSTNSYCCVYDASGTGPASHYVNGTIMDGGSKSIGYGWATGSYPALGSRYGATDCIFKGGIQAIRLYNRCLTAEEVAFNAAIDGVRFRGEDPDDLGIRLNEETGKYEIRVRASCDLGTLSVTEAWYEVGTTVQVVLHKAQEDDSVTWSGLPDGATVSADGSTVTFTAVSPVTLVAHEAFSMPARVYVPSGLIAQWDGIDNAGTGRHVSYTNVWVDLCGRQRPWCFSPTTIAVAGTATINARSLALTYSKGPSATMWGTLPPYRAIEVCSRYGSGAQFLANRDPTHIFIQDSDNFYGHRRVGNGGTVTSLAAAKTVAGTTNTYSISYGATSPNAAYTNGVRVTATFSNGTGWCEGEWPTLGSRYNTADCNWYGDAYAIRLYDRALTATEAAFNAAVDRIRFRDADLAAEMAALAALPDGYRWDDHLLQLEVRAACTATGGTATVSSEWNALYAAVTLTFEPDADVTEWTWSDLPVGATVSDDRRTVTFSAVHPVTARVAPVRFVPSALVYVPSGLIAQWDGVWNAASGHDTHARSWTDLTGKQSGWTLDAGGYFGDDAFLFTSPGSHSAYKDSLPAYKTAEFALNIGTYGTMQVLGNTTEHRRLFVQTADHYLCANRIETGVSIPVVQDAAIRTGNCFTVAAAYQVAGNLPEQYYIDGVARATTAGPGWGWTNGGKASLGSLYNSNDGVCQGKMHALRLYGRPLTATEAAFNAAMDRVRFRGAEMADVVPALDALPDGYRWNASTARLEVLVGVSNVLGRARVNGALAAGNVATAWVPVGDTVTLAVESARGAGIHHLAGLRRGTTLASDRGSVAFAAAYPAVATAYPCRVTPDATQLLVDTAGTAGKTNLATRTTLDGLSGGIHVGALAGGSGYARFVLTGAFSVVASGSGYAAIDVPASCSVRHVSVTLYNGAALRLEGDLHIDALTVEGAGTVDLNGHVLTVDSRTPASRLGWAAAAKVVDAVGGGALIRNGGTRFVVR